MERSQGKSREWLVTYSDLITLLMVFFVLLYIMTPGIDEARFESFISHFQRSVGMMEHSSVLSHDMTRREMARAEIMEQWEAVEAYLQENGLSSQVDVEMIEDGVRITLRDELTFESGSSELLPAARLVLAEIAGELSSGVARVEVEGHTDNVPISSASRYQTNWHLGAARSVTVLLYLQERSPLTPEQYKAVSFGEHQPVTSNSTEYGRSQNRRVEIYIRYQALMDEPEAALPSEMGVDTDNRERPATQIEQGQDLQQTESINQTETE